MYQKICRLEKFDYICRMKQLKQWALFSFKEHTYIREWGPFIILVLIAKLIAMCFSIFAGYFYFLDLFTRLSDNNQLSKWFAIVNLILLELSTAIALSKAFKFLIHRKYYTFLFILSIALGLFSISFISSTNGLAMRQADKIDQSKVIQTNYSALRDSINTYYELEKSKTERLIETIKNNPQGWEGKKRSRLLSMQLLQIDTYYKDLKRQEEEKQTKLAELREEQRQAINLNVDRTEAEADKYYRLVAVIMLIILGINGLLMYFYSQISKSDKKLLIQTEISRVNNEIDKHILTLVRERIKHYFSTEEAKPTLTLKPKGNYCKHCGIEFKKEHKNQTYCSDECRVKYWEGKK